MAVSAPGASTCSDPGNPLSILVRTPGTQGFIHLEQVDTIQNISAATPSLRTVDNLYSWFYTRPNSPYNFDPYMSYPPPGSCLVHQTSGDAYYTKSLRGALPASASLSPQPNQVYNNGTQVLPFSTTDPFFSTTVGGTINSTPFGMNLLGANGTFTIDAGGAGQTVISLNPEPPPGWTRPNTIIVVPRRAPLALTFTPGDVGAPTAILLYSYAAATNSTVEIQCLALPGASTFTISADSLANLPPSYLIIDGSYAELMVGTLGLNHAISFTKGVVANGVLLNSSWLAQSVVLE
jgi:hypothetical protein